MKRKNIFLVLSYTLVASLFIACSNDSSIIDIGKENYSATGSASITHEAIQNRLSEIGDKYGLRVVFDASMNPESITENVFVEIERLLSSARTSSSKNKEKETINTDINKEISLIEDSSVDYIKTISASSTGETYSGNFDLALYGTDHPFALIAIVRWYSNDSQGLTNVEVDVQMGDADYVLVTSFKQTGGSNSHPSFIYSGDIYTYSSGKIGSFNDSYNGTE